MWISTEDMAVSGMPASAIPLPAMSNTQSKCVASQVVSYKPRDSCIVGLQPVP